MELKLVKFSAGFVFASFLCALAAGKVQDPVLFGWFISATVATGALAVIFTIFAFVDWMIE